MIDESSYRSLSGRDVIGQDGEKVGTVADVFVDDQTGRAEWVSIKTGLFGMRERFLPLQDAQVKGDQLLVPYGEDTLKEAPDVDVDDGRLSADHEAELFRHYGMQYSATGNDHASEATGSGYGDWGVERADPGSTVAGAARPVADTSGGTGEVNDYAGEATGSGYGAWGVGADTPSSPDSVASDDEPAQSRRGRLRRYSSQDR